MSETNQSTNQPNEQKENKRNCGAFWVKINGAGDKFLSDKLRLKNINGTDEEVGVFLFKNEMKSGANSPDFHLVLTNEELLKRSGSNKDIF